MEGLNILPMGEEHIKAIAALESTVDGAGDKLGNDNQDSER